MRTTRRHAALLAALLAAGTSGLPPAMACGYDSGLGAAISAAHPNSLGVALAIRDALDAKRITALPPMPPQIGLMRANGLVRKTNQALGARAPANPLPPVALLLVEQHQWNRYIPTSSGSLIASDVVGPLPDDVVLVTGEVVLNALLEGRLGWSEAVQRGLVVVTGEQAVVAAVSATLAQGFQGNKTARLRQPEFSRDGRGSRRPFDSSIS